jgi:hypothetical protein
MKNKSRKSRTKRGNPIIHAWDAATEEERCEFFKAREFEIYALRHHEAQMMIDECRQELRKDFH